MVSKEGKKALKIAAKEGRLNEELLVSELYRRLSLLLRLFFRSAVQKLRLTGTANNSFYL
jgi:hypothetical protein